VAHSSLLFGLEWGQFHPNPCQAPSGKEIFQPAHSKEKKAPAIWRTISPQIAKLEIERKSPPEAWRASVF
jgi:hypothetical protein